MVLAVIQIIIIGAVAVGVAALDKKSAGNGGASMRCAGSSDGSIDYDETNTLHITVAVEVVVEMGTGVEYWYMSTGRWVLYAITAAVSTERVHT